MPTPPAAFSPFTTTKSGWCASRSPAAARRASAGRGRPPRRRRRGASPRAILPTCAPWRRRPSRSRRASLVKRYGDREALRGVSLSAGPRRAGGGDRPQRRRQDHAALDPRRHPARRTRARSRSLPAEIGWVPQQAALYGKLTVAENLRAVRPPRALRRTRARPVERMLELTDLRDRADDQVGTLSGGNRQRVNIAIGLLAEPEVLLLDEPSAALDPRQRERLWEFILRLAGEGTTVIYATHNIQEADRYAQPADRAGRRRAALRRRRRASSSSEVGHDRASTSRRPSSSSSTGAATDALAAPQGPADPAPLAAAGGAAGALPDRDRRADRLRALARAGQAGGGLLQRARGPVRRSSSWAASAIDLAEQGQRLFDAIDPVRVDSREEAIQKVKDGDVLGALIIPERPRDEASSRRSSRGRSRSSTTPRTRPSASSSRTRSSRRCRPPTPRSRSGSPRRRCSCST